LEHLMPRKVAAAKKAPEQKSLPAYAVLIAKAHAELIRKHHGGYTSSTLYFHLVKKYDTIRRASITQALHRMEAKGLASREGAGHWKVTKSGQRKKTAAKKKSTRALTAYMKFAVAERAGIVAKHPDATFGEVGKLLGAAWRKLSAAEKAGYGGGAAKPKAKKAAPKKDGVAKKVAKRAAKKEEVNGAKAKTKAKANKAAAPKREKKEGAKGRGRSASPKGGRAKKAEAAPRAPKKVARQKTAALADDSNPEPADPRAQKAKISYDNLAGVNYKWQYDDHGWRDYDKKASDVVEGHWVEFQADPHSFDVRAVRSGDWEYQVDFKSMTQTNVVHPAHTVRKLRRVIA
jgi:hypothetical protein